MKSDRNVPGFTILEDIDKRGFRSSVRTFLPDGELMPFVNLTVITPPIYERNQLYQINRINPVDGKSAVTCQESDQQGRLKIKLDGGIHEVGINKTREAPNLAMASFQVENHQWATHREKIDISVRVLNKGRQPAAKVTARLEATRPSADILKDEARFGNIGTGEAKRSADPFTFLVKEDGIEVERFRLIMSDENGNEWKDFIDIPIRTDEPEIEDFVIADGKEFEVAAAGDDTVTAFLGKGNGDGEANPGESIVILVREQGRYFRTFLHTSSPYVNPAGIHIRKSDNWSSYDHVGGSAKYSVPVLASDCPEGHGVNFF
ncbi:MAG: hypothetical protein R6U40_04710, partial [Desulfobacterales bacterium]